MKNIIIKILPIVYVVLSVEKDSQFVIYGEVNDLSVNFKEENTERYFYLTIYLYDAFQGHLVFSKQYRQKAAWEYEITNKSIQIASSFGNLLMVKQSLIA